MTTTAANYSATEGAAEEDVDTNRRQLLGDLIQQLEDDTSDWQPTFLRIVAAWPKQKRAHW